MNLLDLASCSLRKFATHETEPAIPDDVLDHCLSILNAVHPDLPEVDIEVSVSRTFDRKGYLTGGDPCGDRNAAYSQGDGDGYLVAVAVHFPAGHRALTDEQRALDATLARIRVADARARADELAAQIAALDATRAALAAQRESVESVAREATP